MQSLGRDAIFAKIDRLECSLHSVCDRCGAEYQRNITIEGYQGKYVLSVDASEDKEEEILFIDAKNGVIDLGELIFHAIKLEDPFVNYCPACEQERAQLPVEDEDEFM